MAALMRAYDWAATPLGAPSAWPRSLQTIVRVMLTSRYAMWMGWGPELTFFYNDAYGAMVAQAYERRGSEPDSRSNWKSATSSSVVRVQYPSIRSLPV